MTREGLALGDPARGSAAGRPRVVELDPRRDPRCRAFVASRPDRMIYHQPEWLDALARGYGHSPSALACEDEEGRLMGVLPLCRMRGLLSGRRLVSLPHTPVAGPLATGKDVTDLLLEAAVHRTGAMGRSTSLQIKTASAALAERVGGLVARPWSETYVRELPDDVEQLRFGPARNHGRLRWAVNKALKQGVTTREASSGADLRAWYRLYLDTMRSHAVPPRPYAFFEALWTGLRPAGMMRLLLAERADAGGTRLLAGSMLLACGETVSYAFNGRRPQDLGLRPNDLIQWRALHDACETGYRWYDFGEVEPGQAGLAEFKTKWGAKPRVLHRCYFPAPRELERGALAEGGRGRELAGALWRRLPLGVTARTGRWLYRYL